MATDPGILHSEFAILIFAIPWPNANTTSSCKVSPLANEVHRQTPVPALPRRQARHEARLHDSRADLRLQLVLPHLLQLGAAPQEQGARAVVRGDPEDVRLAR